MRTKVVAISIVLIAIAVWCDHYCGSNRGVDTRVPADIEKGTSPTASHHVRREPGDITNNYAIIGHVVDEDGMPVPHATILVISADGNTHVTTATGHGSFATGALDDTAPHILRASSSDHYGHNIQISSGVTAPVTLVVIRGTAISITVVDERTDEPLGGATLVDERGRVATTDAQGHALLSGNEPPSIRLEVSHPHYAPKALLIEFSRDSHTVARRVTLRAGIVVRGSITDVRNRPIASAWVDISTPGSSIGTQPLRIRTNGRGEWAVGVALGTHRVRGAAIGYRSVTSVVTVGERSPENLVMRLEESPTLRGIVLDATGNPAASALVILQPQHGPHVQTLTQQDGTFRVDVAKPTDPHRITGAHRAQSTTLRDIVPNAMETIELRLSGDYSISGTLSPDGSAKARASISLRSVEVPSFALQTSVGEHGEFKFEGLFPGQYEVALRHVGDVSDPFEYETLKVSAGTHNVRIPSRRTGSVTGRVVQDGVPLPHYAYSVTTNPLSGWQAPPTVVRSEDGLFEARLPYGDWHIVIVAHDSMRVVKQVAINSASAMIGDIVVPPAQLLRGRVKGSGGVPLRGATVVVRQLSSGRPSEDPLISAMRGSYHVTSDARGEFAVRMPNIAGEPDCEMSVSLQGYKAVQLDDVRPGTLVEITLTVD